MTANPPGVEGPFDPNCRECKVAYSQAVRCWTGFVCSQHGNMSYGPDKAIEAVILVEAQKWAQSTRLDGDIIRELKARVDQLEGTLAWVISEARSGMSSMRGHDHFDNAGTRGANCPACINQRKVHESFEALMEKARAVVQPTINREAENEHVTSETMDFRMTNPATRLEPGYFLEGE